MRITDKTPKHTHMTLEDVNPGQVFSFDSSPTILLMTESSKYVRLLDGSLVHCRPGTEHLRVKIYEHELILKGIV